MTPTIIDLNYLNKINRFNQEILYSLTGNMGGSHVTATHQVRVSIAIGDNCTNHCSMKVRLHKWSNDNGWMWMQERKFYYDMKCNDLPEDFNLVIGNEMVDLAWNIMYGVNKSTGETS